MTVRWPDKPMQIYRTATAFTEITAAHSGTGQESILDYPGINEGVRGMKFLEAAVASASEKSFWKNL